jgi:hypothetical protein
MTLAILCFIAHLIMQSRSRGTFEVKLLPNRHDLIYSDISQKLTKERFCDGFRGRTIEKGRSSCKRTIFTPHHDIDYAAIYCICCSKSLPFMNHCYYFFGGRHRSILRAHCCRMAKHIQNFGLNLLQNYDNLISASF